MTIQYADATMVPALRKLWDFCFPGEGDTYCNLYFSSYFDPHHCCVILDDAGDLSSCLFWFDAKLNLGNVRLPVILLYAGCTYPQYRKQGQMTRILEFITEHCKKNQIYAFLANTQPSSRGLTEKFGMYPCFYLNETMCAPSGRQAEITFSPCSLADFTRMRKVFVDDTVNAIYWEGKELQYMYFDIKDSGAVLKTQINGQDYYAVATRKPEYLLIRESNLPLHLGQELVDGVCSALSYEGPVKLQTRLGQVPTVSTASKVEEAYFAHFKILVPHEALSDFQRSDPQSLRAYFNLTAN